MTFYFASKANQKLYEAKMKAEDYQSLYGSVLTKGQRTSRVQGSKTRLVLPISQFQQSL